MAPITAVRSRALAAAPPLRVVARRLSWPRLALLLPPLLGLALAIWVSVAVFEGIPHNEDELAFLFQSKVFARGAIAAPSVMPFMPSPPGTPSGSELASGTHTVPRSR